MSRSASEIRAKIDNQLKYSLDVDIAWSIQRLLSGEISEDEFRDDVMSASRNLVIKLLFY